MAASESAQALRAGGKLQDARAQVLVCEAAACPGPVRADCTDLLREIDRVQPHVVFEARDEGGAVVPHVRLTLDGTLLPPSVAQVPVAMDPGAHQATFEADGFAPGERRFEAHEEEQDLRVSVVLRAAGARGEAPSPSPGVPEAHPLRTGAYVALGVGAAGVAVGTLFGVLALGDRRTLDDACPSQTCRPGSQGDIDAMHSHAVLSNVGWAVGLAGVGTGVVLWLVSRDEVTHQAAIHPWVGAGSAGLRGTFR